MKRDIVSEIENSIMYRLLSRDTSNITEADIRKCIKCELIIHETLNDPLLISDEEINFLVRSIQSKLEVKIEHGICIKQEHTPWFGASMRDNERKYWRRYEEHLKRKGKIDVNELHRESEEIMDFLGNPNDATFQRRGLIMGDVQAGKTAMYTAIMNKAADAGYKVVIILTGIIEKLRKQTQGRLDSDFRGEDSLYDKDNIVIGVGEEDNSVKVFTITTKKNDFNKKVSANSLSSFPGPVLFVVKKQKTILTYLELWLKRCNSNAITLPMLLIDDEADNAGINIKSEEEDPSAINACINKLLKLFTKSNYIGVTATPYANIFVNPKTEDDMLKDNLFPRDFIYAMHINPDYIGARNIYPEEGEYHYMLQNNDDCEACLPLNHKKFDQMIGIPDSLKEALASFFIINAIRDLRGKGNVHRSMLINITRFIDLHNNIYKIVCDCVDEWKSDIRNYYKMGNRAQQYDTFIYFKKIFEKHFIDKEYTWEEVRQTLGPAVADICVRIVNGGNASKELDYEEHKETGLKVIAIGGISLSRGLTLEGLCVSYFYRNSKMYDTLMQMGRWFGYREHYADLCQIWMGETMVEWYRYISEATDDLRDQIRRMNNNNKTPNDFGLAVRSDMSALVVTARNKMRMASDYTQIISLSGNLLEAPYLHSNPKLLLANVETLSKWIEELKSNKYSFAKNIPQMANPEVPLIQDVPLAFIRNLLMSYNVHSLNSNFNISDLLKNVISDKNSIFQKWDVALASLVRDKERISFLGEEIVPLTRKCSIRKSDNAFEMKANRRIGSTNFIKSGLSEFNAEQILNEWKKYNPNKHIPDKRYLSSGIERNPLLIIYPISLSIDVKNGEFADIPPVVTTLAIGIPKIEGEEDIFRQYKRNEIARQNDTMSDDDDFEETDEKIEY